MLHGCFLRDKRDGLIFAVGQVQWKSEHFAVLYTCKHTEPVVTEYGSWCNFSIPHNYPFKKNINRIFWKMKSEAELKP